jgi:hypothetical protein
VNRAQVLALMATIFRAAPHEPGARPFTPVEALQGATTIMCYAEAQEAARRAGIKSHRRRSAATARAVDELNPTE